MYFQVLRELDPKVTELIENNENYAWVKRMHEELLELDDRIFKLNTFKELVKNGVVENKFGEEYEWLMSFQLDAMISYGRILSRRFDIVYSYLLNLVSTNN